MTLPKTVILVPGFMSPAWMMYHLELYLKRSYESTFRWDYPRVFADLDTTVHSLATLLDRHPKRSVSIVAHSFGDWIVCSALNRVEQESVNKLVSVCPVTAAVPIANVARSITGDRVPEFIVMASNDHAAVDIPDRLQIDRCCIWARGEVLVSRPDDAIPDREVWATHNSVLFQPNVWKVIREELAERDHAVRSGTRKNSDAITPPINSFVGSLGTSATPYRKQ